MADYTLAQSSVLGSMLIDERCAPVVLAALRAEDFDEGMSRDIFNTISDLFLDGEKVDPVTVLAKLGGPSKERRKYIRDLMAVTPTARNVEAYIDIVREQSRTRQLRVLGAALCECQDAKDAQDLVSQINDLMGDRHGVRAVNMMEALQRFFDRQERKQEYLTWGLRFLDEGIYAQEGTLLILGGRPSDGKTAFALSTAFHQAHTKRVGFFSLETDEDTLFDRLFSSVAKVDNSHIKKRELTEDDSYALTQKVPEIKSRNLHLIEAAGMTVRDIQAYSLARKFDVVYVDYLQLIRSTSKWSRYEQVTEISQDLHRMAQNHKITVVALSQLSRAEKQKNGLIRPPALSDLRESGQIEQDADVVLFIYREDPNWLRSPRNLRVAKNKEGETGQIALKFDGKTQTFSEDFSRMSKAVQDREPEDEPYQQVALADLPTDTPVPF